MLPEHATVIEPTEMYQRLLSSVKLRYKYGSKQEVLEITDPPTFLTSFNTLHSLQRYDIAPNYGILHAVV
jgi:hypothetical protein